MLLPLETLTNDAFTSNELDLVRSWRIFNTKICQFRNKSNLALFNHLYTEEHGERLLFHWKCQCNQEWDAFETYLTSDQLELTIRYITKYF